MSKESVALVKLDSLPSAPIADITDLREAYKRVSAQANLITPVQHCDYIPAMHRVSLRAVVIDPDGRDIYKPSFCQSNERAPGKTMILKLLQAAGGSVLESKRTDDGREQYVSEHQVRISVPMLDGSRMEYVATKRVDYRDGSPQVAQMKPAQLAGARQFLNEMSETKALLRAVRGALALGQKYTVDELSKPFVVPALVPDLDTSDPEIRKMVAAKALGLEHQLYPATTRAALPPASAVDVSPERDNRPEPVAVVVIDDDVDEFGEPPAETPEPAPTPAGFLCGCACGDQAEVSEQVAHLTTAKCGGVRCAKCWPWAKTFDQGRHRDLGSLGMAAFLKMDGPAAIAENVAYLKGGKR